MKQVSKNTKSDSSNAQKIALHEKINKVASKAIRDAVKDSLKKPNKK